LISVVVATADGATAHYCTSCTIGSGRLVEATGSHYITQDYVHRLSGSGSVTIGAIAQYADNGAWGNYVSSTSTEVTHSYGGDRPAWGAAANFGPSAYLFDAHVTY